MINFNISVNVGSESSGVVVFVVNLRIYADSWSVRDIQ